MFNDPARGDEEMMNRRLEEWHDQAAATFSADVFTGYLERLHSHGGLSPSMSATRLNWSKQRIENRNHPEQDIRILRGLLSQQQVRTGPTP